MRNGGKNLKIHSKREPYVTRILQRPSFPLISVSLCRARAPIRKESVKKRHFFQIENLLQQVQNIRVCSNDPFAYGLSKSGSNASNYKQYKQELLFPLII